MEQNKIDIFIASMTDKLPNNQIMAVRAQLEKMDDSKFPLIQSLDYKNPIVLLVVSILLGQFGIDRFMLGQIGLGILKLVTCGGCGIWTIVDWFLIMGATKDLNFKTFIKNV